jgi:aspartate/methionine/tyrosine aminotransferase
MNKHLENASSVFRVAQRMAEIEPFHVVELFNRCGELSAAGHRVVNLCIGEPDFPTPEPIVEAARQCLERGRFPYTPSLGIAPLRQAISRFYNERFAVGVPPERIIVTAGASGALLLTMGVLVDPGDEVLLTDPGYPCNFQFVRALNGVPIGVPVESDSRYQLTAELIGSRWTPRTIAALIASPANPTGAIVPHGELQRMIDRVSALGGRLIVDEIYQGLTYGSEPSTALSLSDEVFVINSFSKYFQMTGWRLGWMVVPSAYAREIEKLAQNLYISNSTIAQHAALGAFTPQALAIAEARRAEFHARRDFLIPELEKIGFGIPITPEGAFYVYADCSKFTDDSYGFAWEVLEKAHVAMTPGVDFGIHQAARHVRLSYCTSLDDLAEGLARLKRFLG